MEIKSLPQVAPNLKTDLLPNRTPPPAGTASGRDFAEVLEQLSPEEQSRAHEHEAQRGSQNAHDTERPAHKRAALREEQRPTPDCAAGLTLPLAVPRMNMVSALPEAREVLSHEDIARMISVIRTLPGGQREVTLELTGSVLAGLRVKLQATATGRVMIDFIAKSEQIKHTLDARASELSDLLRMHRINLVEVKTSLSASTEHGSNPGHHAETTRDQDDRQRPTSGQDSTSQQLGSSADIENNEGAMAELWRA